MMGYKIRCFQKHREISLEQLVPEDNFYRLVENAVNFSFVRDLVRHLYADLGRPSIDPVGFFKLQLIAFFEGIRSERQLMEQVHLNIAHRWFIGYDFPEAVSDHSSLSKIRERYGLEVFHQFFERVVEMCAEAGLVWGEELYFDGTNVRANADVPGLIDRAKEEVEKHLEELSKNGEEKTAPETLADLVEKYDGTQITGRRKSSYQRLADEKVSPVDPDATPMRLLGG